MPLASPSLWTPDGNVPLTQKDVIPLQSYEVQMLSRLHEWAGKYNLAIVCKDCDGSITGQNNDAPDAKWVSVACKCREWRYSR